LLSSHPINLLFFPASFFFQAEDGIRDFHVTGVQTCALPISERRPATKSSAAPSPRFFHRKRVSRAAASRACFSDKPPWKEIHLPCKSCSGGDEIFQPPAHQMAQSSIQLVRGTLRYGAALSMRTNGYLAFTASIAAASPTIRFRYSTAMSPSCRPSLAASAAGISVCMAYSAWCCRPWSHLCAWTEACLSGSEDS